MNTYYPPNTKFQKVKLISTEKHIIQHDKDENEIIEFKFEEIPPKSKKRVSFILSILKNGNASIILPHFGKWKEYREITAPNTIGEIMIKSSRFWPLKSKNLRDLVQILKNNAINASEFIQLAFEFVNQKVTMK
ncbi:MAG: hypothetical protein DRO88_09165 [Promethearchaeia archaeon]|nr:MAG: hypothetical protein DRO88_09165 [Candidatus Lokiarchaeia archaeon]